MSRSFKSPFRRFVVSLLFLFTFTSQAKYDVVDFKLKNGLRIVCIKKKTSPIIFFSIWYKCGAKNDAISKSGVAHYLEHMAFSSNKMEFSDFLEDVGAEKNAFTSFNMICFHEVIPNEHIETVFIHESGRMISLDIEEKAFLSEKGAILEERSVRIDNNPEGAERESLWSNIFNRETGGIEVIGWKHEIEGLKKGDLRKFHDKWFAPNNAVIVIAGDFNLDKIKALAEKYFGQIPPKEIPSDLKESAPADCLKEIKYGSPKNGSSSSVDYVYRAPFSSKENLRKAMALEVAIMAMNQPGFFVKKTLKDVLNRAAAVSFSYIDRLFQYDIVCFEISSSSIDALRDCEDVWRYLKNKLTRVGISKSELDAVKKKYLISLAYRKDDIVDMANHFGYLLTYGYSIDEIQSIDDMIQSFSEKECNDALMEIFSQKPIAVLRVEPKGYDRE